MSKTEVYNSPVQQREQEFEADDAVINLPERVYYPGNHNYQTKENLGFDPTVVTRKIKKSIKNKKMIYTQHIRINQTQNNSLESSKIDFGPTKAAESFRIQQKYINMNQLNLEGCSSDGSTDTHQVTSRYNELYFPSTENEQSGIDFNKNKNKMKKVDYQRMTKNDLITLLKISNQKLDSANKQISDFQNHESSNPNNEILIKDYEQKLREKDIQLK